MTSPAAGVHPTHARTHSPAARAVAQAIALFGRIPHGFIALLGRFSIAAVFWKSGQTKVEGFALDLIEGEVALGIPRIADSAVGLFREEYKLPLIPPELAAPMAAFAEHLLPALILVGLATRLSAFGLLVMTLVIQLFVYPGAYPTHGVWATVLLYLMATGPGWLSMDRLIMRRVGR